MEYVNTNSNYLLKLYKYTITENNMECGQNRMENAHGLSQPINVS